MSFILNTYLDRTFEYGNEKLSYVVKKEKRLISFILSNIESYSFIDYNVHMYNF